MQLSSYPRISRREVFIGPFLLVEEPDDEERDAESPNDEGIDEEHVPINIPPHTW